MDILLCCNIDPTSHARVFVEDETCVPYDPRLLHLKRLTNRLADIHPTVQNAITLADAWHSGQKRKFEIDGFGNKIPYIYHPLRVAYTASFITTDVDTIIAAVLHDMLEDTNVPPNLIVQDFGQNVFDIVSELTVPRHLTSDEAKYWQLGSFLFMKPESQTIKLLDRMDNLITSEGDLRTRTLKWAQLLVQVANALNSDAPSFLPVDSARRMLKVCVQHFTDSNSREESV